MSEMNLGGVTAAAIGYALDGLSLRQSLIASNIANGTTAGYRPMSVEFESRLAAELSRTESSRSAADALDGLERPSIQFGDEQAGATGSAMAVDQAVLQMNRTVLKYQALVDGLNRYMSMTSTAINEGRR